MSLAHLQLVEDKKAENRKLENTKDSGYHDQDADPTKPFRRLVAPQHNGLPRLSDHKVFFNGDDLARFVGDDAKNVFATIQSWYEKNAKRSPWEMSGTEQKLAAKYCRKLKLTENDGVPVLDIKKGEWNDFLWLLTQSGIGLTGVDWKD